MRRSSRAPAWSSKEAEDDDDDKSGALLVKSCLRQWIQNRKCDSFSENAREMEDIFLDEKTMTTTWRLPFTPQAFMEVQCMPNGYLEAMERRVVTETAGVLAEWERMKHRARENGKPMPKVGLPPSLPPSLPPCPWARHSSPLCIHACPVPSATPPFGLPPYQPAREGARKRILGPSRDSQ